MKILVNTLANPDPDIFLNANRAADNVNIMVRRTKSVGLFSLWNWNAVSKLKWMIERDEENAVYLDVKVLYGIAIFRPSWFLWSRPIRIDVSDMYEADSKALYVGFFF